MKDDTEALVRIFSEEVPEISAGIVEIKAIARKPGWRSKLALQSHDPGVDCIGATVGVRGIHIKNIVDALGGERIDLIRWTDSAEQLITSALEPAVIDEVILHPAEHRAVAVVKADQLALAVGRGPEPAACERPFRLANRN